MVAVKRLVYTNEVLLGDSLCTLPAIYEYAKDHKFDLWIENPGVRCLIIDHENINLLKECPIKKVYDHVIETDISKLFMNCHSIEHMTQSHFREFNLPIPDQPIRPLIKFESHLLAGKYFIISPFSKSGVNTKEWPYDKWNEIINSLKSYGSIIILGSKEYLYDNPDGVFGNDVTYLYDRPLDELSDIIDNSELVISIDNGISHLTYAIGAKHILLYPKILPECWVRNPEAVLLKGVPDDLSVETVWEAIKKFI